MIHSNCTATACTCLRITRKTKLLYC